MKRVTRIQTSDGELHDTEQAARRHADQRYGNLLTRLAGQAAQIDKYTRMTEFLEANLDKFEELLALRADLAMEPGPDDDDD